MNLIEVLKTKEDQVIVADLADKKDYRKSVHEVFEKVKNLGLATVDFFNKTETTLVDQSKEIRKEAWDKGFALPKGFEMINGIAGGKEDAMTYLNELPRVDLPDIVAVADTLKLLIIPIEYTDLDHVFDGEENVDELKLYQGLFKDMLKETGNEYRLYMMCPVNYYDMWEHIKTKENIQLYYPEHFETQFEMIDFILPSQKNLYMTTQTNAKNIQNLREDLKANLMNMNNKVQRLADKVQTLEEVEVARKEEELRKANEELELQELEAARLVEVDYGNTDPILFALPVDVDLKDKDATALVGLCWGAELDDIFLEMKGLARKSRNKLNDIWKGIYERRIGYKIKGAVEKFEVKLKDLRARLNADILRTLMGDKIFEMKVNNDDWDVKSNARNGLLPLPARFDKVISDLVEVDPKVIHNKSGACARRAGTLRTKYNKDVYRGKADLYHTREYLIGYKKKIITALEKEVNDIGKEVNKIKTTGAF